MRHCLYRFCNVCQKNTLHSTRTVGRRTRIYICEEEHVLTKNTGEAMRTTAGSTELYCPICDMETVHTVHLQTGGKSTMFLCTHVDETTGKQCGNRLEDSGFRIIPTQAPRIVPGVN